MSKTTVIVFHINEKYSIGFHRCIGASEIYYLQSAGSIYECFVRRGKIINKNAVIDILVENVIPELVHVVPNGEYIEKWKSSLTLNDFLNAKVDEIDVVHENYNIKHYIPKQQKILENDEIKEFYDKYTFIKKNLTHEINNVKCLIWKIIKNEERDKKLLQFDY